ncbi:NUDIX domain-containing protein [Flavobacterium notoginsengisoli]|uniref:NUDIX domain-containing protein n=1 Tax=Flavobacterium notoginsengisoli TaxID=1478199 RepID=UPI003636127D
MSELIGFNVRVYAFCINENKILALHEKYAGTPICKLPGGGLEFGEGTIECLHREFEEELNLKIEILDHHYTQEDFIESRIKDNKQILNIYYTVKILNLEDLHVQIPGLEKLEWIDIDSKENPFVLKADIIAFEKLKKKSLIE